LRYWLIGEPAGRIPTSVEGKDMLREEKIVELAKEAVRRVYGRNGRTFKGRENISRELDAAGSTRQTHGTSICYPSGVPVGPRSPQKEAAADRLVEIMYSTCGRG
jgi:hypothetical protein